MDFKQTAKDSILVAHLADAHLRDTQYAAFRRGLDFFEAFKTAVKSACAKADVLVAVGDIFDKSRPSPRVVGQLIELDRIIAKAGKKMLAVTGNHDLCVPAWLDVLFKDRTAEDNGIIPIDGKSINIMGFDFTGIPPYNAAAFRDNLASIEMAARDADVVLYHGLVTQVVPFYCGSSDPLTPADFPVSARNSAWLLGDIHVQGYIGHPRPDGKTTLIGYPGSTEMGSASESPEKSVPLIRVTKDSAVVEDYIKVPIRPFVTAKIETEEDLDAIIQLVTPLAKLDPVVVAEFSRDLPQTISRLHSILDAQRAVIRCHPLPRANATITRAVSGDDEVDFGMEHFVSNRFSTPEDAVLLDVALALLLRGDTDAANIISEFIEKSLASNAVRE